MPTCRFIAPTHRPACACLLALLLGACAARTRDPSPLPAGAASITGHVASVQLPSVLVVAQGPQPGGSDRASVRVHAGTRVLWRTGEVASAADLRKGQAVRVWYEGPVMESYPIQVAAAAVVIDAP